MPKDDITRITGRGKRRGRRNGVHRTREQYTQKKHAEERRDRHGCVEQYLKLHVKRSDRHVGRCGSECLSSELVRMVTYYSSCHKAPCRRTAPQPSMNPAHIDGLSILCSQLHTTMILDCRFRLLLSLLVSLFSFFFNVPLPFLQLLLSSFSANQYPQCLSWKLSAAVDAEMVHVLLI